MNVSEKVLISNFLTVFPWSISFHKSVSSALEQHRGNFIELLDLVTHGAEISVCFSFLMIYCGKPQTPQRDVAIHREPHCRHWKWAERHWVSRNTQHVCLSPPSSLTTGVGKWLQRIKVTYLLKQSATQNKENMSSFFAWYYFWVLFTRILCLMKN